MDLHTPIWPAKKSMDPENYERRVKISAIAQASSVSAVSHMWERTSAPASGAASRDRAGNCQGSCHFFGSAHTAGWNTVMADGSVQTVDYAISLIVHQAKATIRGGETLNEF